MAQVDRKKESVVPRLSFPAENGKFSIDRMQPAKLDELKKLIAATPEVLPRSVVQAPAAAASVGGDADAKAALALFEKLSGGIYHVLGTVGCAIVKRSGAADDVAALALFNEEELELLIGPTAAVLVKYIPNVTSKYADELVLAGVLSAVVMGKAAAIRQARDGAAAAAKPGPRAVVRPPADPPAAADTASVG